MIEEQARVIRIHGRFAEIVVEKQSACGSCSARSGCGTSLLANWFPRRQLAVSLENVIDAKSGDTVMLGMDESILQRSSLMLYALPLGGLLGGAIAGERGFALLDLPTEPGAVLFGLFGVIAGLIFVRQHSATRAQGGGEVRLLRVLHRNEHSVPGKIPMPGTNQREGFGANR